MNRMINTSGSNMQVKTKDLVLTSLAMGLVYIATALGFELPALNQGGYTHLGTGMIFTLAILLGAKKGAISGAIGSGLCDLATGYAIWAPTTIITRGIMGYVVGCIARKNGNQGTSNIRNIIAMIVGGIILLIGYYVGEAVTFGNWLTPINSVIPNLIQVVVGLPVTLLLTGSIKKTKIMDQLS